MLRFLLQGLLVIGLLFSGVGCFAEIDFSGKPCVTNDDCYEDSYSCNDTTKTCCDEVDEECCNTEGEDCITNPNYRPPS